MRRQNTDNHTHAGASAHLAWGFTNIEGDFLELVTVEVNPENAYEYKTPEGWTRFEVRPETVRWALLDIITIVVLGSGVHLWFTRGKASIEARMAESERQEAASPAAAS